MPRPPRHDQLQALTHIRQCVAEHGPDIGMRAARAAFQKVDKSTWSRWCKQVREEDATYATSEGTAERVPAKRERTVPVATTEVLEAEPGTIDFFGELNLLLGDCDMLRNYSAPADPATGLRKPRNPMMLAQSIKLRAMVLGLAQRHAEAVWEANALREHHTHLIGVLGDALKASGDADMARKVIEDIRRLDNERKASSRYLGGSGAQDGRA
jgi:hypothetical protein